MASADSQSEGPKKVITLGFHNRQLDKATSTSRANRISFIYASFTVQPWLCDVAWNRPGKLREKKKRYASCFQMTLPNRFNLQKQQFPVFYYLKCQYCTLPLILLPSCYGTYFPLSSCSQSLAPYIVYESCSGTTSFYSDTCSSLNTRDKNWARNDAQVCACLCEPLLMCVWMWAHPWCFVAMGDTVATAGFDLTGRSPGSRRDAVHSCWCQKGCVQMAAVSHGSSFCMPRMPPYLLNKCLDIGRRGSHRMSHLWFTSSSSSLGCLQGRRVWLGLWHEFWVACRDQANHTACGASLQQTSSGSVCLIAQFPQAQLCQERDLKSDIKTLQFYLNGLFLIKT